MILNSTFIFSLTRASGFINLAETLKVIVISPKHPPSRTLFSGGTPRMLSLGLLSPGEQGEIVAIRPALPPGGGQTRAAQGELRLEDLGLRVGKLVEMLSNGSGPILLRVDESRIALARGLAMHIMVRRQQ
jgi:ferrous iron transport protein A